jgi:hypothetical protein
MPFTPDDPSKIDPRLLVHSLRSLLCPSCAGYKASGMMLCRPCYSQLSRKLQGEAYSPVCQGYELVFAAAMRRLMVSTIHFPGRRRIHSAAYVEDDGSLHFDIPEQLRILGAADTPENRAEATRLIQQVVKQLMPETEIEVV